MQNPQLFNQSPTLPYITFNISHSHFHTKLQTLQLQPVTMSSWFSIKKASSQSTSVSPPAGSIHPSPVQSFFSRLRRGPAGFWAKNQVFKSSPLPFSYISFLHLHLHLSTLSLLRDKPGFGEVRLYRQQNVKTNTAIGDSSASVSAGLIKGHTNSQCIMGASHYGTKPRENETAADISTSKLLIGCRRYRHRSSYRLLPAFLRSKQSSPSPSSTSGSSSLSKLMTGRFSQ